MRPSLRRYIVVRNAILKIQYNFRIVLVERVRKELCKGRFGRILKGVVTLQSRSRMHRAVNEVRLLQIRVERQMLMAKLDEAQGSVVTQTRARQSLWSQMEEQIEQLAAVLKLQQQCVKQYGTDEATSTSVSLAGIKNISRCIDREDTENRKLEEVLAQTHKTLRMQARRAHGAVDNFMHDANHPAVLDLVALRRENDELRAQILVISSALDASKKKNDKTENELNRRSGQKTRSDTTTRNSHAPPPKPPSRTDFLKLNCFSTVG